MGFVLLLFSFWKTLDVLIMSVAAQFIPEKSIYFFDKAGAFVFLNPFANFDGAHYLYISLIGYRFAEQAFFPLYPILIHLLSALTNNPLLSGLIISHVSFVGGLLFLDSYLSKARFSKQTRFWFLLLLLAFPTSFFFGSVYTESLFLFFIALCLYLIQRRYWIALYPLLFLTSLTRLAGIFTIIPILIFFISERKKTFLSWLTHLILPIFVSLSGLAAYCLYLWRTYNDPLLFIHSLSVYGVQRSTKMVFLPQVLYRYIKIFVTASHTFEYGVAVIEFIVFNLFFLLIAWHLWTVIQTSWRKNVELIALDLFSLANLLLPTLSGSLSSVPRYALLSVSFFIIVAQMKNSLIKSMIIILFIVLHIFLFAFFSRGHFVG